MYAKVYVGTYHKYASGSIKGDWIDLDGLDKESFLAECRDLHKDESDPELMFQDYEGFPDAFYSESHLDERLWDWLALNESDRDIVKVYLDDVDLGADIDTAREAYAGTFASPEDWAADFWESTGMLRDIPESLRNYIDYEAYARDCRLGGDMVFVDVGSECYCFHNV